MNLGQIEKLVFCSSLEAFVPQGYGYDNNQISSSDTMTITTNDWHFLLNLTRGTNRRLTNIELVLRFIRNIPIPMSLSFDITFNKLNGTQIHLENLKKDDFGVHETEFKKSFSQQELSRMGLFNNRYFNIKVAITATPKEVQSSYFGISQVMLDLLKKGKYGDFIIQVEGKEITVHKCILGNASPVFEAMLRENTQESKRGWVGIKNFNFSTIHTMIEFLYSRIVQNPSVPLAIELLRASDMYAVVDLQKWCCEYLLKYLSVANAIKITIAAHDYNNSFLKEKCLNFILQNKNSLKPDDKIKELLRERKDLSMELLWKMW